MSQSQASTTGKRDVERRSEQVACDYCHLPVDVDGVPEGEAVYCCFGCRLASDITGHSGAEGEVRWTMVRLGLAIFLSLNVMMFTMALWTHELYDARAAGSGPLAASLADLFRYLCLLLSLPVLWLLGLPLAENALATRRRDVAAADLLIVVGVTAAYAYSVVSVLRESGHVYFEVGCGVLVMVTIGRWLEAKGKLRATAALAALETLLPKTVRAVDTTGKDHEVPTEQIEHGDRLRVLAGERIATDGVVAAGCAGVSQQLLTGESRPVTKRTGDEVLGGSLSLDGELLIDVAAPVHEGSLARLIEMVRTARLAKGRYERVADRVARWFLSAVLVVAAGTLAFHLWREGIEAGLMAALAVLLIACPCALGLATPMAVWSALSGAARHGVLFRNGEALEQLAEVRALRFDKTGTLTTSEPRVEHLLLAGEHDRIEVARRAARLAGASTHVFSQAIVRYLDDGGNIVDGEPASAADLSTAPGQGVAARFGGEGLATQLGSVRWLVASGMALSDELEQAVAAARVEGQSISGIGWGGRVRGLFEFSETLREEAPEALAACAALGCDVAVLTGDEQARTRRLADKLGVPVIAGLLPEDKVAQLDAARRAFGPVAMVGDGVNDVPALAASDLGIAMGCGADLSRDAAAVCLVSDNLSRVPWALELSRASVRVIRQNLFWAFGYNTVGIGLAAAGWLNPAWAAAAMVFSSLIVVSNSLRLAGAPPEATAGNASSSNAPLESVSSRATDEDSADRLPEACVP